MPPAAESGLVQPKRLLREGRRLALLSQGLWRPSLNVTLGRDREKSKHPAGHPPRGTLSQPWRGLS